MLLTYQYRLQPNYEQVATLSHWSELLRRHWNYALGERLDYLRRTRSSIDRCSLINEPIGEIPNKVDYYSQSANLKETKSLFPEYKNIYADCQQQNLMRLDKAWKRWLIPDSKGKRGGKPRLRTTGLSFAACGDLGVAQSMKQEISGVNLRTISLERYSV
jgi:putative transposase